MMETETTKKSTKSPMPIKKLYFDEKEMHYAITDSDISVTVILDKGWYSNPEGGSLWTKGTEQYPEVKVEFERKWNFDDKTVLETTQAMMMGQRPIKKVITTHGVLRSGDHRCMSIEEVIATLVEKFIEVCTPVFGFKLDFSCLKGSQIEVIFNRAIAKRVFVTSQYRW